jgi:hypothetical protein
MTELLDTTVREPSMTPGEAEMLLFALDRSRAQFAWKVRRGAVERARVEWSRAIADGGLDQPSKFKTSPGQSPNLRRILVDLHDEYARHVGHADLFRESIDGRVGEDPPQA